MTPSMLDFPTLLGGKPDQISLIHNYLDGGIYIEAIRNQFGEVMILVSPLYPDSLENNHGAFFLDRLEKGGGIDGERLWPLKRV